MNLTVLPAKSLSGTITVPGDKSISHRAVMLGALAKGKTEIEGFLHAEDCLSTINCFRALGVPIEVTEDVVVIEGKGLYGLKEPEDVLNVGNSGTTIRLLTGILSGQPWTSFLTGDSSIRRRPMGRVTEPLKEMGAQIWGRKGGTLAPLAIKGGDLKAFTYHSPTASAQVKSAILLAGLYAPGWTEVVEPVRSRDHTEVMLSSFGAEVSISKKEVRIKGQPDLLAQRVIVPGDISSAAFFMVAGLIVPESKILIESVGLNPTRAGIIEALQAMGAKIRVFDFQLIAGELIGSLEVETSELRGITLGGDIIPRLIDEIPILAVAGAFASGVTEIRDAAELKVKESNRIQAIAEGLVRMGAKVEELPDGLRIYGQKPLQGALCKSYHDHRIAMSLAVAALASKGETQIEDAESVNISFPKFSEILNVLKKV